MSYWLCKLNRPSTADTTDKNLNVEI